MYCGMRACVDMCMCIFMHWETCLIYHKEICQHGCACLERGKGMGLRKSSEPVKPAFVIACRAATRDRPEKVIPTKKQQQVYNKRSALGNLWNPSLRKWWKDREFTLVWKMHPDPDFLDRPSSHPLPISYTHTHSRTPTHPPIHQPIHQPRHTHRHIHTLTHANACTYAKARVNTCNKNTYIHRYMHIPVYNRPLFLGHGV